MGLQACIHLSMTSAIRGAGSTTTIAQPATCSAARHATPLGLKASPCARNPAHNAGMRIWSALFALLALMVALIWASDAITLQGERTVYAVECRQGTWRDAHCDGQLVPGHRYRFRALKAHREVIFWTSGAASEPSGKLPDCEITDGRNWVCKPNGDAPRPITLQMSRGIPLADSSGHANPFHAVSKIRWYLMQSGYSFGSDANN